MNNNATCSCAAYEVTLHALQKKKTLTCTFGHVPTLSELRGRLEAVTDIAVRSLAWEDYVFVKGHESFAEKDEEAWRLAVDLVRRAQTSGTTLVKIDADVRALPLALLLTSGNACANITDALTFLRQVKSLCKGFSDFKLKEGMLYLLGNENCQLEVRNNSKHVRL